jgi:hypothetical protein
VVECLPSLYKVLSSSPSTKKQSKQKMTGICTSADGGEKAGMRKLWKVLDGTE